MSRQGHPNRRRRVTNIYYSEVYLWYNTTISLVQFSFDISYVYTFTYLYIPSSIILIIIGIDDRISNEQLLVLGIEVSHWHV